MKPLADAAARQLAVERFEVPVLLEAGAGTGKTRALVSRLLTWTLGPGWREAEERLTSRARERRAAPPADDLVAAEVLDGLVAITFTEAAAAEMAGRLATSLAAVAAGQLPEDAAESLAAVGPQAALRARRLVDELGRARIQTIHAFCRGLLAEHPFEAGLHPGFRVDADEREVARLADEVLADQLTARLAGDGDPDLLALLADRIGPEELRETLLFALREGVTPADLERDPLPAPFAEAWLAEVARVLAPFAADLAAFGPRLPRNQTAATEMAGVLDALLRASRSDLPPLDRLESVVAAADEILARWEKSHLAPWASGEGLTTIEKKRPEGALPFPTLAAPALSILRDLRGVSPARLGRLRRLLAPLLGALRERMRRQGAVLFSDLLARAADLLERRRDVRDAARRGIRQLLVDEFQDTDRQQCRLIAQLALAPGGPPPPGLFVVGDPKQSIYGWRRADLAAYEAFLADAVAAGGVRARLEVNFRSLPAILDEVTRAVAPSMVAEPGIQPEFQPLVAWRTAPDPAPPAVEFWCSATAEGLDKTQSAAASRIEAAAVARDLLARRAAEPQRRWSDFGILLRTTSDQEIFLQALRVAGVPFEVERDRSYWRRREVIDLNAAVRAILLPGDHLALLALLRSPFVGVPDAALVPLWRGRLPERFDALGGGDRADEAALAALFVAVEAEIAGRAPGLERIAGWAASAGLAAAAVGELRRAFGREPADTWVERLRARLAPEATAAGRFLGRFGVANLARYLRELARSLDTGGHDPGAVVRELHASVAEQRADEEARPATGDGDAVRVMSIHRAKGLEFPHLYLVQLHKAGRGDDAKADGFEPALAERPPRFQLLGIRTPGWEAEQQRRQRLAGAERVRLLYVALTRARDRLVVAGQFRGALREDTLGRLLEHRLGPAFAATELPDRPTLDALGVLLRAPAVEAAEPSAPAPRPPPAATTPSDAEARRLLDRLTDRRADAARHAARPRLRAVSETSRLPLDVAAGGWLPPGGAGDAAAMARGRALHRAFELAPLAATAPDRWRSEVFAARAAPPDAAAQLQLERDLERLLASDLWRRRLELEPAVLARELPLLLASPTAPEVGVTEPPLDGWIGTLDLLYRDPASGELVVADFKSDRVDDAAAEAAKVATYGPQLRLYGAAVAAAFAAARPPRLELWLLARDRIVEL